MTEPVTTQVPSSDDYVTVEAVAEFFGVHKRTVLRWIEKDEIAHVRYGKAIRIPKTALEARPQDEEAS